MSSGSRRVVEPRRLVGGTVAVENFHDRWLLVVEKAAVGIAHVRLAKVGLRIEVYDQDSKVMVGGLPTEEGHDSGLADAAFHVYNRYTDRSTCSWA